MNNAVAQTPVSRRYVLKLLTATGSGLLLLSVSNRLLAEWPAELFGADNSDELITRLTQGEMVEETDAVVLKVPQWVENPAILPVSVECALDGVKSISLLIVSNRNPLVGTFKYGENVNPLLSTRVRLEQPGEIIALVHASDRFYLQRAAVDIKGFDCEAIPTKASQPVDK